MEQLKHRFRDNKCCVLIPTYNNRNTIAQVIKDVLEYTDAICVVNDGSTDDTLTIIQQFSNIKIHTYSENRGKGFALQTGFMFAIENGYEYAITIDSDGQHYASDLPIFIDALERDKNCIFIGARNMTVENVPGKSNFGNKFSNFWFKLETGIELPDTQSGYRLYPLKPLQDIHFFSNRYEFEVEVIVRAAWDGVGVEAVPVKVYYPPAEERVSHFRPLKDFTRISILNSVLVIWLLLYIKPRDLYRLLKKKSLSEFFEDYLFRSHESPAVKAGSVALGMFFGIAPFWGFQMILVAFFAWRLKLNNALALVVSNISIPPMIPLLLFLSYEFGAIWMPKGATHINFSTKLTLAVIHQNVIQYVLGSFTFATIASVIAGLGTYFWVKFRKEKA
jgi:glycosyltransferase involved in cell wall biosynthesis